MLKKFAFLVIACGVVIMMGFSTGSFLADSEIPEGFRIGIVVIMAGCLLMIISVGWERYREWKSKDDDFRGVKY